VKKTTSIRQLRVIGRFAVSATHLVKVRIVDFHGHVMADVRLCVVTLEGRHVLTRFGFRLPLEKVAKLHKMTGRLLAICEGSRHQRNGGWWG